MIKGSFKSEMAAAVAAWPQFVSEELPESREETIERCARANGVSPAGLYRALIRTGALTIRVRGPRKPKP